MNFKGSRKHKRSGVRHGQSGLPGHGQDMEDGRAVSKIDNSSFEMECDSIEKE